MLYGLKSLNPLRCCFTNADYKDAITSIEAALREVVHDESPSLKKLEEMYALGALCLMESPRQPPDKHLAMLLSLILSFYAAARHDENAFAAKQMLVAAMNLHLYSLDFDDRAIDLREFDSLQDLWNNTLEAPHLFAGAERRLQSLDADAALAAIHTATFAKPHRPLMMLQMALTAKYLCFSYRSLDAWKKNRGEDEKLLKTLLQLSEGILILSDNKKGNQELANLYLQAAPQLITEEEKKGPASFIEKILALDSSPATQARLAEKLFHLYQQQGQTTEALASLRKSVSLAERLDDNEKNGRFLISLYDLYANACLAENTLDLEEAEIYFTRTQRAIAQRRSQGIDLPIFAVYDVNYATFKLVVKDLSTAEKAAERAIATLKKYPHSQKPTIYKAEALLDIIRSKPNDLESLYGTNV